MDVPLGAAGSPHPVVCPDGTLYMVGQGGKITVVDRQGKVGSDSHQTVLKAATALACDAQERLYVASPDFVAVVEPKSTGDYRVVSTGYVKISAYAIAAAEDGRIFVAGRRAGNGFPLHLMTTDGKMIRSFGEGSPNSDPSPVLMDGFLPWNASERRLLMAPRTMPEIQVYSGDGDEVSVKDLGLPQWDDEWIHELLGYGIRTKRQDNDTRFGSSVAPWSDRSVPKRSRPQPESSKKGASFTLRNTCRVRSRWCSLFCI